MVCSNCQNEATLVPFLFGGNSYYCRTCKLDVSPVDPNDLTRVGPKPVYGPPPPPTPTPTPVQLNLVPNAYFTIHMTQEEWDFWEASRTVREACIQNRGKRHQLHRTTVGNWRIFIDAELT